MRRLLPALAALVVAGCGLTTYDLFAVDRDAPVVEVPDAGDAGSAVDAGNDPLNPPRIDRFDCADGGASTTPRFVMPDSATSGKCLNGLPCPAKGAAGYGQDGQVTGPAPTYDTSLAVIVKDQVTGLWWTRALKEQLDPRTTSPDQYCADLTLGGQGDWRLPTLAEAVSILDYGRKDLLLDTSVFPAPNDTTSSNAAFMAWQQGSLKGYVNQGTGVAGLRDWTGQLANARCVRP